MRRLILAASCALSCLAGAAEAAPFAFTFTDTISSSTIPGLNSGDTVTLTVIADNGGTSILNQAWNLADLVSASLTGGTYSANYNPPFFNFGNPVFTTDGAGVLTLANFYGTGTKGPHSDTFGSGGDVYLFSDGPNDFNDRRAYYNADIAGLSSNLELWSGPVAVEAIPEPATLALLGAGLLGLAAARRRKG